MACKQVSSEDDKEQKLVLKHHIQSIIIYKTDYFAGVTQPEKIFEKRMFDSTGNKTSETHYDNGIVEYDISYHYTTGKLTEVIAVNATGSVLFKETRTYDEKGNRKELISYPAEFKGTYKYRNIAEYDHKGRMTKLTWFRPEGIKAINRLSYIGHRKTADAEEDSTGHERYRWQYHYNSKGDLSEAMQVMADRTIASRITYAYDSAHHLVRQANYKGEDLVGYTEFTYENDLVTRKTDFSPSGKITTLYRYEYIKD